MAAGDAVSSNTRASGELRCLSKIEQRCLVENDFFSSPLPISGEFE